MNRPWWPSGLEGVSNSSRHSLEDPGSNPARGIFIHTKLSNKINNSSLAIIVVPMYIRFISGQGFFFGGGGAVYVLFNTKSTKKRPLLEGVSQKSPQKCKKRHF